MTKSDFYYDLPQELIAQFPVEPRDHSRLLVMDRHTGVLEDRIFYDIKDYLHKVQHVEDRTKLLFPFMKYTKAKWKNHMGR